MGWVKAKECRGKRKTQKELDVRKGAPGARKERENNNGERKNLGRALDPVHVKLKKTTKDMPPKNSLSGAQKKEPTQKRTPGNSGDGKLRKTVRNQDTEKASDLRKNKNVSWASRRSRPQQKRDQAGARTRGKDSEEKVRKEDSEGVVGNLFQENGGTDPEWNVPKGINRPAGKKSARERRRTPLGCGKSSRPAIKGGPKRDRHQTTVALESIEEGVCNRETALSGRGN